MINKRCRLLRNYTFAEVVGPKLKPKRDPLFSESRRHPASEFGQRRQQDIQLGCDRQRLLELRSGSDEFPSSRDIPAVSTDFEL
jgi:hypothetical protein